MNYIYYPKSVCINYSNDISGKVIFKNCTLSIIQDNKIQIDPATELEITNSPQLSWVLLKYKDVLKNNEEEIKKQEELRKNLKYGYKVVYAPVLVKLSFPENAKVINIDRNN